MPLPDYKALLWLDAETTGLDPGCAACHTGDLIVEIAATLTTLDLEPWSARPTRSWLVGGFPEFLAALSVSPVAVYRMHAANGLLDEFADIDDAVGPEGYTIDKVEQDLLHLAKQSWRDGTALNQHEVALAGSGVKHFDSTFLRRWMPELADWLHPSPFDLGPIRRAVKMWAPGWIPNDNDAKPHRAPADVAIHLADARLVRDAFKAAAGALAAWTSEPAPGEVLLGDSALNRTNEIRVLGPHPFPEQVAHAQAEHDAMVEAAAAHYEGQEPVGEATVTAEGLVEAFDAAQTGLIPIDDPDRQPRVVPLCPGTGTVSTSGVYVTCPECGTMQRVRAEAIVPHEAPPPRGEQVPVPSGLDEILGSGRIGEIEFNVFDRCPDPDRAGRGDRSPACGHWSGECTSTWCHHAKAGIPLTPLASSPQIPAQCPREGRQDQCGVFQEPPRCGGSTCTYAPPPAGQASPL